MEFRVGTAKVILVEGDITSQSTDAIVNAANSSIMGGGGVDGAIHRRGGPRILEQCKKIRQNEYPKGLPTGKAVITTGGDLPAKFVIHTVGPIYRDGKSGEPELLADAYQNSLTLAANKGLKTIAFPSISTGAYGYPILDACRIALSTVKQFLEKNAGLDEVVFVLFGQRDFNIYKEIAIQVF